MEAAAARTVPVALRSRTAAAFGPDLAEIAAGPLSTRISSLDDAVSRLSAAWDALAAGAAEPNVFAERWFVAASLPALAGDDVRLIEVWDSAGATLVALLPVAIGRNYSRLPLRHVVNWLHHHSFLGAPLVRAGHEQRAWTAILAALDKAEWARGLLHMSRLAGEGPVIEGLHAACRELNRPCAIVYRAERALLSSDLSPQAYYERTVRKKKRKEIKRLAARLDELGTVSARVLERAEELDSWCDAFLALEQAGWKGEAGSALGCDPGTAHFFRRAVAGAHALGRLNFRRLDLDGRPIAMLVNFLAPPGSFSFKIAFDPDFARFSPGVLIQIDNFAILDRPDIGWMDSCAMQDHKMINSLWGERRAIVRVTLPFADMRSRLTFHFCRALERTAAALRGAAPQEVDDDDD